MSTPLTLQRPFGSPPKASIGPDKELESNKSLSSHFHHNAFIPGFRNQPPFRVWFCYNWLDIATQLLCLLAALLIYQFSPPLMPRYFPLYAGVERSSWGHKYGRPYMKEYINTWVSAVVSYAVPAAVMGAIGLWGTRDFWDGNAAVRSSYYQSTLCELRSD